MAGLVCHSCGANSQPDGSSSYVVCGYCSASISVAAFFKGGSTNTLEALVDAGLSVEESKRVARLFEDAENYIELNEHDSAKRNFEEILKIYPRHIPSRLNIANCLIYDSKVPPIERGLKVKEYVLSVGNKHQEIAEVLALKESIAFNLAAMGEKLTNGIDGLKLIQLSVELQPIHEKRDSLAKRFFDNLSTKLHSRVQAGFRDSKEKYSPTQSDIEIMVVGSAYCPSLANLCATMLYHFKNNQKSIHQKLLVLQNGLREAADRAEDQVSVFTFPFFSGMQEKKVAKKIALG